MKRYVGIGAAILVAGGLSEVVQGILLTWIYEPTRYASGELIMPSIVRHGLTALIAVLLIYGVGTFRKKEPEISSCPEDVQ